MSLKRDAFNGAGSLSSYACTYCSLASGVQQQASNDLSRAYGTRQDTLIQLQHSVLAHNLQIIPLPSCHITQDQRLLLSCCVFTTCSTLIQGKVNSFFGLKGGCKKSTVMQSRD
jgi:hypothetical protein